MEEEIIQPIDKALLKSELTPDKQLRMTNKSHNEIYIVTANDSPNVLKEIGRLRELLSVPLVVVLESRWTWMSLISERIAISNSLSGILRLMKLSVVIAICWERTGN